MKLNRSEILSLSIDEIKELTSEKWCIIDLKVLSLNNWPIHGDKTYVIDDPEKHKSLETLNHCLTFFLSQGLLKSDHIYCIGGGALLDLAGLVAHLLYRGIHTIYVPTTLLSQVDACIGGKTALNFQKMKNVIGAFHSPSKIFLSHQFLNTLSQEDYKSGLGELIKHAMLNQDLYDLVLSRPKIDNELLKTTIEFKDSICERDFYDNLGVREQLNLGHTIGHVIESLSGLSHGECVMYGMFFSFKLFASQEIQEAYKRVLDHFNIKLDISGLKNQFSLIDKNSDLEGNIRLLMKRDKKNSHSHKVKDISLHKVGDYYSFEIGVDVFVQRFIQGLQNA